MTKRNRTNEPNTTDGNGARAKQSERRSVARIQARAKAAAARKQETPDDFAELLDAMDATFSSSVGRRDDRGERVGAGDGAAAMSDVAGAATASGAAGTAAAAVPASGVAVAASGTAGIAADIAPTTGASTAVPAADTIGEGGPSAGRDGASAFRSRRARKRWPLAVAGIVLVIVLVAVATFSWNRWLRYDDAADFQGSWQSHGSTAVVVVDGESIKLTEDVAYAYTLDTGAKTVSFTFGNMVGQGRYRFSLDRSQLVIIDGEYSWFSTLLDDAGWLVGQLWTLAQGRQPEKVEVADGMTVLDRLSNDASATPQRGEPVSDPDPAADAEAGKDANAEANGDADANADAGTDANAGADGANASDEGGASGSGAASDDDAAGGDAAAADSGDADKDAHAADGVDAADSAGEGASKPVVPSDMFDVNDRAA